MPDRRPLAGRHDVLLGHLSDREVHKKAGHEKVKQGRLPELF